jgi:hypothetical protein
MQGSDRVHLEADPFTVGGQAAISRGTLRLADGKIKRIVAKRHAVSSSTCERHLVAMPSADSCTAFVSLTASWVGQMHLLTPKILALMRSMHVTPYCFSPTIWSSKAYGLFAIQVVPNFCPVEHRMHRPLDFL